MTTLSERVKQVEELAAKAVAWNPSQSRCEAGYKLNYDGACRKCGAEANDYCGRRYESPKYELQAVAPAMAALIRDLKRRGLRQRDPLGHL